MNTIISFISHVWGSHTSEKWQHVIENCGFLEILLPGYMELADCGFFIWKKVGIMSWGKESSIPPSKKRHCQLDVKDEEKPRVRTRLTLHWESDWQCVQQYCFMLLKHKYRKYIVNTVKYRMVFYYHLI